MKIKVVGIGVCIMLLATFFTVAQNVQLSSENTTPKNQSTVVSDAEVPQWTIGNSWSYRIDTIKIDYEDVNTSTSFHASLETENITLEVVDDFGDSYTTRIGAVIHGEGSIDMNTTDGQVSITVELQDTDLVGNIVFNKSDLGIKQINAVVSGKFVVNIIEQPFVPFHIPTISIPGTINVTVDSSVPYTIIKFPLNISEVWGLPATNVSLDGTIESTWLNLAYHLNNFAQRHPLLINLLFKIIGYDPAMFWLLSDFLANPDILPVIHIGSALQMLLNTTSFEFPEVSSVFLCNNTENITVPAGTFLAYNISVGGGVGNLYYATDAGMIIKISGRFNDILPFITDFNAELIEYKYP